MKMHSNIINTNKRILIIQEHLPSFRIPFYVRLKEFLASNGIELQLIFAPNQKNTFLKSDLEWATPIPIRWFGPVGWQSVIDIARKSDLVIVQQEVKYLINPLLQLISHFGGPRIAYWGHGKNFQSPRQSGLAIQLKNFLSTKVHWWFAYNDLSARVVKELGYPESRITSVGNAVDTTGMIQRMQHTSNQELAALRNSLGIQSEHVAVYTGGLYQNKRVPFLIESARIIRSKIPDFHLIVIGNGPERQLVTDAAKQHSWIHDIGPLGDQDKVPYWLLSKLLLMPGLVGLVVVDSFALGTPIVTTDYPFHSPEIDYLKNNHNGLIVSCGDSAEKYANEVISLLIDEPRLTKLREKAIASSRLYTIETMAQNFTNGILQALNVAK